MKPVYLGAAGMVSALGAGAAETRAGLLSGSLAGMQRQAGWCDGEPPVVGAVTSPLPELPAEFAQYASRATRLLLAAVGQIRAALDAAVDRFGAARVGIVLATATSGIEEGTRALEAERRDGRFPPGYAFACQEVSAPSDFLRAFLRIEGPAYTISTACTAGAKALIAARRLLAAGVCDAVIAGGTDALTRMTIQGFDALESMSAGHCLPLSANRDGINIGEGAAVFLVGRESAPVALFGAGEAADAYHISAPDPEGRGAEAAMRAALADAGIRAADVDYVNLHGTATRQNDAMEAGAVARVFGDRVSCSATKPLVGHTLGTAGALEAAFLWLLLAGDATTALPPHVYDGIYDPALPPLRLVTPGQTGRCRYALSNSFAFGGSNAALVLGRG